MSAVTDAWNAIRADSRSETGWHARRVVPSAVCDICCAIRQPGDVEAILLEVSSQSIPAGIIYPAARGFTFLPETAVPGPHGRVRLCLTLTDTRYRDVFEVLCEDVVRNLETARTETQSVTTALARLQVWQEFLRKSGPEGLSEHAQIGLFGELTFLEQMVLGRLPDRQAIGAWAGPLPGVWDFQFLHCTVEVKSSASLPFDSIAISSLAQLDDTQAEALLVCQIGMTEGDPAGSSLPGLVTRLRTRLADRDSSACIMFDDRLLQAGYLDAHSGRYEARTFGVRWFRFFRVRHDFPRIRTMDVRAGVAEARYTIRVPACLPYEISAVDATAFMLEGYDV